MQCVAFSVSLLGVGTGNSVLYDGWWVCMYGRSSENPVPKLDGVLCYRVESGHHESALYGTNGVSVDVGVGIRIECPRQKLANRLRCHRRQKGTSPTSPATLGSFIPRTERALGLRDGHRRRERNRNWNWDREARRTWVRWNDDFS